MSEFADTVAGPGYRYSDSSLHPAWHTSVPKNDEDAIQYMRTLTGMGIGVAYVERREPGEFDYKLLPTFYDAVNDEFRRVGT
jgi:hypothetical protein